MRDAILHLNYVSVVVAAIVGFILGWLWFGVVFGKAWMTEMKITPEQVQEAKSSMAGDLIKSFLLTLLSTFGLAMILHTHGGGGLNWKHGAAVGLFIGVFVVAVRQFNSAVFEKKSCKLKLINGAHEMALYALQGAILAFWR